MVENLGPGRRLARGRPFAALGPFLPQRSTLLIRPVGGIRGIHRRVTLPITATGRLRGTADRFAGPSKAHTGRRRGGRSGRRALRVDADHRGPSGAARSPHRGLASQQ
jgi:hypothetical protein